MSDVAPILLVSPDGMLGRAWEALLENRGIAFTGVGWPQFDLLRPETVEPHLRPGLRTVVNCSAWTDVDGAETREADATAINAGGVALLASHCRRLGATLVHFSTDYVFDGLATAPYAVDHPLSPVNAYGRSKAAGEKALAASGCNYLLVRTSWLYAPWSKNFVRTMMAIGRDQATVRVVSDQFGRPTSAEALSAKTLALLERGARGTFHVTDGGSCSWYELATEVMRLAGSACRVEPCSSTELSRPAKRPAWSVLDLARAEALLGPFADWKKEVAAVVAEAKRRDAST